MRHFSVYTFIALITFVIGCFIATLFIFNFSTIQPETKNISIVEKQFASEVQTIKDEIPMQESPEAKAIRIAEEFVAQNGYTDLPADKSKVSYETVDFARNLDERLKLRANTLERKAYGILYKPIGTKTGRKGWTVAFRENVSDDYYKQLSKERGKEIREDYPIGRTVTMNANYEELLMEHKTFPLSNVDKKL